MKNNIQVAVLLRGQGRINANYIKNIFNKFTIERFPNVEFKFFPCMWNFSVPFLDDAGNSFNIPEKDVNKTHSLQLYSNEYIYENFIKPWNPSAYRILSPGNLTNVILKLLYLIYNDPKLYNILDIFDTYVPKNMKKIKKKRFLYLKNNLKNYNFYNHVDMVELKDIIIRLHYFLGQFYNSSMSYNVYYNWKNKNNYNPDILWSTRIDSFQYAFNDNFWEILNNDLERLIIKRQDKNYVITEDVKIDYGTPYTADYSFYLKPSTACKFFLGDFANFANHLYDILTHKPLPFLHSIFGKKAIPEFFWTLYGKNTMLIGNANQNKCHTRIWKPNISLKDLVNVQCSVKDFEYLQKKSIQFINSHNRTTATKVFSSIDKDIINQTFGKLTQL